MKNHLPTVTLGVLFLLAPVAYSAEIGWEYEREVEVNEFDDTVTVTHRVINENDEKGISISCEDDENFRIFFVGTGTPATSRNTFVKVRVDKKPMQEFLSRHAFSTAATVKAPSGALADNRESFFRFIHDLVRGNKLIFQVGVGDTVALSLAGITDPISKLLKGCNISPSN